MISINLLPVELRPIKRTPLPYIVVLAIAVIVGIVCGKMYISDISAKSTIKQALAGNQAELKTHQANIEEYNQLVAKKKLLATKLNTINEIASDRLIWSYHLNTLARLAPDNLWYDTIEETSRTETYEVSVTDPKTGKVSKQKKKRVIPVLKLVGAVSADEDGLHQINPFLQLLTTDEEFSSMFQIEPPKLKYKTIGEDIVRTFEINCVIAPKTGASE